MSIINTYPADTDHQSRTAGQPVAGASLTGEASSRPDRESAPSTQPTLAVPKPTVDWPSTSKTPPAPAGLLSKLPLHRPSGNLYLRTSDSSVDYKIANIINGDNGNLYVLDENLTRDAEIEEVGLMALLVPCVDEHGQAFVWCIPIWMQGVFLSSLRAVLEAQNRWVRVKLDVDTWTFKTVAASAHSKLMALEPNWPLEPSDVLDEVLKFSTITSPDDPLFADYLNNRHSQQEA